MISGASSAAASFAGGERSIDIYLHEMMVIINAEIKAWRMGIAVFAGKKQDEIELLDDEDAVTAAEDCDQLKRSIGKRLKTWVMHVCDQLTTTDPMDKEIRYRMAKYVDRKRAMFKKHRFLTDKDAKDNIDWQHCCILPTGEYIINHEGKRCNMGTDASVPASTTGQDKLLLGAEASGLQLQVPLNVRGRSKSPADQQRALLEAQAAQMAKEKEEHEKRMTAQRQQIAAMGHQVQENKKMRQE